MKEHAENKMNEMSENNSNLRKQRDSMLHSFKMLVERIEKEKKKDAEKFEQLVITSESVLKVSINKKKLFTLVVPHTIKAIFQEVFQ